MNHLPENFFVSFDLFLDWQTFEQARRFIRGLQNFSKQDATYSLFMALIDLLEGNLQEALRSFSELLEHRTLSFAALIGQLGLYERQDLRDERSIEKIHSALNQAKIRAEPDGLFLGSWILFHQGKFNEASDSLQILLQNHPSHGMAHTLTALIEMRSPVGSLDKARAHIDSAIKLTGEHVCQARLAMVYWYIKQKELDQAQTEMREMSNIWVKVIPVRVASITLQMALGNWDAVADAVEKLLALDPQLLIGHFFLTFSPFYSAQSTKGKALDGLMLTLLDRLQKAEAKNPSLWAKYARICSRSANGDGKILEKTSAMMLQMTTSYPNNGSCLLEAGDQLLLLEKPEAARSYFQRAMMYPACALRAMIGETKVLIKIGTTEQAEKQCDRLNDLLKSATSAPTTGLPYSGELAFMRIQVETKSERRTAPKAKHSSGGVHVLDRLSTLISNHLERLKGTTLDLDCVLRIEPFFVAELIQEILQRCPTQPMKFQAENSALQHCANLLSLIHSSAPGLTDLTIFLARVHFLKGDLSVSIRILESVIESERFGKDSAAFIVAAEVYLTQGTLPKAKTALDRALANSFAVKNSLRFLCLQASLLRSSGNLTESIALLTSTLDRPGVRKATEDSLDSNSLQDRCSVHLDLADAYLAVKDSKKAWETLKEAEVSFCGTSQEARVVLARAEYLTAVSPKSKTIVELLQSLAPDAQDFYGLAQQKLGQYYLKNGMHKEYVQIYERLFEQMKETPTASIMLGNAYLKVPMASKAIEVIQIALKRQPGNLSLESAMGLILTKCHMFANALNYYEAAVKKGNKNLRPDYIGLLMKLKRYERAEDLATTFVSEGVTGLEEQMQTANFFKTLAEIQGIQNKPDQRLTTLTQAKEFLEKLNLRVRRENADAALDLRRLLVDVLYNLSDSASTAGDYSAALQLCKEAQSVLQGDLRVPALLRQARIHLHQNDTGEAFRLVKEVQKIIPENSGAQRLLGDIALRRKDFDMAASNYREFLRGFSEDYLNICKIIPLLARIGQINLVKSYLDTQTARVSPQNNIFFDFCTGVYLQLTGDIKAAIAKMMPAIKIPQFRFLAAKALMEILCNWDTELIGSRNLPSSLKDSDVMEVCKIILTELPPNDSDPTSYFIRCLPVLCNGTKTQLELLLSELEPLERSETELVEPIPPAKGLALVTTLLMLDFKERAVVVLRKFEKTTWNIQDADYLERLWLLLAEQQDISNRGDEVSHLVFRAMEFNRSGYIVNMYEGFHCGVQNFPKAAECFRRAFEATGNQDFVSGERYAWAQLNANRPMEVIDGLDTLERKCLALRTTDEQAEGTSGGAASIQTLRNQAMVQLALRIDERRGLPDAAGRRQSRV